MQCYHPVLMWKAPNGRYFTSPPSGDSTPASRPCGSCVGCKQQKSADWTLRCTHELSGHAKSCFATLTYAPAFLPSGGTLQRRDLQLFLKKLRKKSDGKLRHFGCGEYGDLRGRPHYHLILFGFCPDDLVLTAPSRRGWDLYDSQFLRDVWGKGLVAVSPLTRTDGDKVGAYIAAYTLKRDYGQTAPYETLDELTGEILPKEREFVTMPTRPGLGASWFDQFGSDLVHGYVSVNGSRRPVPRYYRRLAKRDNPQLAQSLLDASDKFRLLQKFDLHEESKARHDTRESIHEYHLKRKLK